MTMYTFIVTFVTGLTESVYTGCEGCDIDDEVYDD